MKKSTKVLFSVALLLCALWLPVNGHSQIFWRMRSQLSDNFWLGPGSGWIERGIESLDHHAWLMATDEEGLMDVDNGDFFGFKAKDLFNNPKLDMQLGFMLPSQIIGVGIYGNFAVEQRKFGFQPDRNTVSDQRYKINQLTLGAGADITLFYYLLFEIGADYHKVYSCRTSPYGGLTSQFNNYRTMHYGAGLNFNVGQFLICWDLGKDDLFNRNFTMENGAKPYAGIESKVRMISFQLRLNLLADD